LGDPDLQRIRLDTLIASLSAEVATLGAPDGIHVRFEPGSPVEASADPTYVGTILENLLDNSLHALRNRGGTITIRLAAEGGRAVVSIGDEGPPLDPEIVATLFDPLRTTKTHGLGLGLPIARALARAMRGELVLDGNKVFRLELPLYG
jgi:signal transduction histidine kinase